MSKEKDALKVGWDFADSVRNDPVFCVLFAVQRAESAIGNDVCRQDKFLTPFEDFGCVSFNVLSNE